MIEVSGETESDVIGKGTDLGEMAETGRETRTTSTHGCRTWLMDQTLDMPDIPKPEGSDFGEYFAPTSTLTQRSSISNIKTTEIFRAIYLK